MLQSFISILPAVVGADGSAHRRKHRRFHHRKPIIEDPGNWIWIQESETQHNFYLYARKLFEVKSKPTKAILKASADSKYKLFVNGEYVGKGPVRSGAGYTYYDTYDITELLNKGKNVIAFLAHSIGEDTYSYASGRGGLICKCDIEVGEEKLAIDTDETWMVHRAVDWTNAGARLSSRLGFQEVYDAANRFDSWNQVKFKEKGWENAVVVGTPPSMPWGKMIDRQIPQLHEEKVLPLEIVGAFNSPERTRDTTPDQIPDIMAASELSNLSSGSVKSADALLADDGLTHIKTPRGDKGVVIVLDFGREVFGNVEIGIAGSGSGVIDLGYSERLEDGRVKPNFSGINYTDRVILNKGRLDWQGFEPRAFRYLQIEFRWCSRAVALEYVKVNQTTYPVQHAGYFECSDRLLNEIWRVGAYTAHLCMEDTFIDCPWRERAQWWGDARIESRVAYYAFDDTALLAQGLRQIAQTQQPDGMICGMYPASEDRLVPDFALFWVFSILDHYAFTDDIGMVRELYPNVKRLLSWFEKHSDNDGLLLNVPGWLFIDWADLDKHGNVTALNCLYYQGLRIASVLATIIGQEDEAAEYAEATNKLKMAINKHLYSVKQGLYADCRVDGKLADKFSHQANILAALFELPDHYQKSTIYRQLMNGSLPEINTPYFMSHLLETLYAGERHDDALNIIRKKWGDMIKAGATTFWEHFTPEHSLCHGWSTSPTRDLIAEYVGIKPALGSHRFTIAPHTGDLTWAQGTINTNAGPLTVEWRVLRNSLAIRVDVPQGLRVDIYPPCDPDSKLTLDGKAHPSRFMTVEGGTHHVKVTAARAPKAPPLDESLKPKPIKHVEMLQDISPYGMRRPSTGTTRRRTRSKRSDHAKATAPAAPIEALQELENKCVEPLEIEPTIEIQSLPEPTVAAESAEKSQKKPRRRSHRGGRRHSKAAATVAEVKTVETVAETASPVEEKMPDPMETAPLSKPVPNEQAAEAPKKKRRYSSRRGGVKHKPKKDQSPEQITEQKEQATE